jgi:FtsZ-binding cell division protein ZapB
MCIEKLQLINSCIQSIDSEANSSHAERDDLRDEVHQIIRRVEEAKQEDYVIWQNKIQVCIFCIQDNVS